MSDPYVHGEMDISEHNKTWSGFMTGSLWASFIIVLVIAYATFTITMGIHWMVALGLLTATGIIGGILMGMGSAWITTVVGLAVLGIFVQIIITFASWAL